MVNYSAGLGNLATLQIVAAQGFLRFAEVLELPINSPPGRKAR